MPSLLTKTLLVASLETGHTIGLSLYFKPFADLGHDPVICGHVVIAPY